MLSEKPPLTQAAIKLLRSHAGADKFRKVYGDFYVCGYVLGADAGACLSAVTDTREQSEKLEVAVTVKVLFFKSTVTHTETKSSVKSSVDFHFCGYNTLENKTEAMQFKTPDNTSQVGWFRPILDKVQETQIRDAANTAMAKVSALEKEVRKRAKKLQLRDGKRIPLDLTRDICEEGIVIELLLAPFARLGEYVEYASPRRSGIGLEF
jgi:hypothetical protein